jgi:hypothetical protein
MSRQTAVRIGVVVLVAIFAGTLIASGDPVSGKWDMNVKGPAAHGDLAATMLLANTDGKVTGTFSAHGNEHKLAGSFKDGTLQLETTDTPADKSLSLTAKLQEDGTLSGYLSSPMGDMKWSAARVKDAR